MSRSVMRARGGGLVVVLLGSVFVLAATAGSALAAPPTVTTGAATNVIATSATLNGTVDANGDTIAREAFDYGTAASGCSPSQANLCSAVLVSGSPSNPSAVATGLSTSTPYVFFLVADDTSAGDQGFYHGQAEPFTTPAPPTPSIALSPAVVVSEPGCDQGSKAIVKLAGTVSIDDPNSMDGWGWSLNYSTHDIPPTSTDAEGPASAVGSGQLSAIGSDQRVAGTAPVEGRIPAGTYYYWLQVNGSGPAFGSSPGWFFSSLGKFVVTSSCGSTSGDLPSSLGPSSKGAMIAAILTAGGYAETVQVPGPGTLAITWDYVPTGAHVASARPIVIASMTKKFDKTSSAKIKIRLTSEGRQLLKKAKHLKLTAVGSFKPKNGKKVTERKTLTLSKG